MILSKPPIVFIMLMDARLDEVEGYFRSCDAKVTTMLKTLMKHEYLILGKNSRLGKSSKENNVEDYVMHPMVHISISVEDEDGSQDIQIIGNEDR